MKSIHHSHWHTSVDIHGPESLYGRTIFLSTNIECAACLQVNIKTFRVEKAKWEIYRGPDGPLSQDIGELEGVEAYIGSGEALRRAMKDFGARALSLASETVRGIIQAETFTFRERGFTDIKSYDKFWEKMYLNSCRYYSNLNRVTCQWETHVSVHKRTNNLFNRFKGVSVSEGSDIYYADASLTDSFHEVGVGVTLDKDHGTVTTVDCRLLRAPDRVCFEAGAFAQNLLGLKLTSMSKKEIAGALAGNQGCVHMIDLCSDLAAVLRDLLECIRG
ncbi:MAG: DUF2889 domain-containing protein [Peptococcaceae bacterium]|nr:DUF2889 domain-containing protein [Peptococcaceae bacterium]